MKNTKAAPLKIEHLHLKLFRNTAAVILTTLLVVGAATTAATAQTFTTLHSFDYTDGTNPAVGLVQATDGGLYGSTQQGGGTNNESGTIFKISPAGTLRVLGAQDSSALVQATDGNFYGTTIEGGVNISCDGDTGCGTVFKITPSGTLTTIYSFCSQSGCTDGGAPLAALVQGSDGNFYGTTVGGGAYGYGTVFKITPTGALTTLHTFCSQPGCLDGESPAAALIQATDGNFYGTTWSGGANACVNNSCGTVFKITSTGTLTTLHSFDGTDGQAPNALVQASDGTFYGTTVLGGNNVCAFGFTCGTVFKISPGGTFETLYSFCSENGCADGSTPSAMVQATDGNFYGTAENNGADGYGTIFKVTPRDAVTTLYTFCSQSACADGSGPLAALVQDTNGDLYGTTAGGGANGEGTVFSLSVGLGPFVETQTTSGKVGTTVKILGTNLTGATSVSFNGTAATFTVLSGSFIKTTVPEGATTGFVTVTTPGATLTSNQQFRVRP